MPEIKPPPGQTTVRLPVLRSVVDGSRVLLRVSGSLDVPVGDTQGMFIGPDGYTANVAEAQDFAPAVSDESVIIESPGAPGKSAYQLWLDDGHQGPYSDYYASLRGEPGITPTPEQISATVAAYIAVNPPKNGESATDAQVSQAVLAYLSEHPPADGKSVEIQAAGGFIQARQTGGQWINLIAVASLAGTNGKSVELQKTSTAIQWRPEGGAWADLVLLSAITGPSPMVALGSAVITQVAVLALSAGIRSVTLTVSGVLKDDNILLFPTSALPSGYAIHNVVATAKDTIQVTFSAPLLALGASFTIACRVVALR